MGRYIGQGGTRGLGACVLSGCTTLQKPACVQLCRSSPVPVFADFYGKFFTYLMPVDFTGIICCSDSWPLCKVSLPLGHGKGLPLKWRSSSVSQGVSEKGEEDEDF